MHLTAVRCEVVDWIQLTQSRDQWLAIMNTVAYFRVSAEILIRWATTSFSKSNCLVQSVGRTQTIAYLMWFAEPTQSACLTHAQWRTWRLWTVVPLGAVKQCALAVQVRKKLLCRSPRTPRHVGRTPAKLRPTRWVQLVLVHLRYTEKELLLFWFKLSPMSVILYFITKKL
jgi:hypothetical protein